MCRCLCQGRGCTAGFGIKEKQTIIDGVSIISSNIIGFLSLLAKVGAKNQLLVCLS